MSETIARPGLSEYLGRLGKVVHQRWWLGTSGLRRFGRGKQTPRVVIRIEVRMLKLAWNIEPSDSSREGKLCLSVDMVVDRTAALVLGYSADLPLQIFIAGFHSYSTGITMVGRVSGRGFFLMTG